MVGCLLFLVGVPLLLIVGLLILINLVVIIEDYLTGGKLLKEIVKEIKREPIVIHDVVIERDGKEDLKWNPKSDDWKVSCRNGTKNTGRDIQL